MEMAGRVQMCVIWHLADHYKRGDLRKSSLYESAAKSNKYQEKIRAFWFDINPILNKYR